MIDCNCPRCQQNREPFHYELKIPLFYDTVFVKAKDFGKVKFEWKVICKNICRKTLKKLALTYNQKYYQWVIRDAIGHLVEKSENTTPAEANKCW